MTSKTLCFAALLLLQQVAGAAVIVDQAFDDCKNCTGGLMNILAEGFAYTAQSVTAGVRGNLVRVDLNAGRRADFTTPWEMQLIDAPNGEPSGRVLASQLIHLPINTGADWRSYDLQTPIKLEAGDQFLIALHPQGITGHPGLFAGAWHGGSGDPYSRGRQFDGTAADAIFPPEEVDPACLTGCRGWDLNFRTYMTAETPELSSLALGLSGLMLIGLRLARRFKRR